MSLHQSLARPYAKAVFMLAKEKQTQADWESFLEKASDISKMPSVFTILKRAFVEESVLSEISNMIAAALSVTQEQNHFLKLLAEEKRLVLLPIIYDLFVKQIQSEKNIYPVILTTAIALDDELKNQFKSALEKKLGGTVILETRMDERILGGAVISINDDVIDASIHNQLRRLFEFSLKV